MTEISTFIIAIIVGFILLSIGLCLSIGLFYKIAQLSHRLKLSDKENEDIRNKYAESESNLKKEISKLRENISDIKKKHSQEISNLKKEHFQDVTKLFGQKAI